MQYRSAQERQVHPMNSSEKTWNNRWPLERVLFTLAGSMAIASAILTAAVSPWFVLLTAFIGLNQLLYASVGFCGASLILLRFTNAQPACRAVSHPAREQAPPDRAKSAA
jgi:Protein of unknown function (DUF2892)